MRIPLLVSAGVLLAAGCYDPYAYPPPAHPPPHGQAQQEPPPPPQPEPQQESQQPPAEPPVEGPVVTQPPPAPQVEEIPPPPFEGAVWIDGYWSWTGTTYTWVPGRYESPPQVGLYWYPGGYILRPGGGYVFVAGRWARPGWRHRYRFVYGPRVYYRAPIYRRWRR